MHLDQCDWHVLRYVIFLIETALSLGLALSLVCETKGIVIWLFGKYIVILHLSNGQLYNSASEQLVFQLKGKRSELPLQEHPMLIINSLQGEHRLFRLVRSQRRATVAQIDEKHNAGHDRCIAVCSVSDCHQKCLQ